MTRQYFSKSWRWVAVTSVSGLILWQSSHVQQAVELWDITTARYLNGFVGQNLPFDIYLATLNSSFGDKLVVSGILLIFAVHALAGRNPDEFCQRAAFWTWLAASLLSPISVND